MEPKYLYFDVIKRNGNTEKFNTEKIMAYINLSTDGLEGVDGNKLFEDLVPQLKDEMKTSDIQKILTVSASEKIDIDCPNWTFVAARLFLFDLYHTVSATGRYYDIKEYITQYVNEGKLHPTLLNGFNFDKINKAIDPTRDFLFNYLGVKTLHDRYLLKNSKGKVIELPQHMFMCIAMFLASKEKEENKTDWAIKFYNVLSRFEAMVATPTLANARTLRNQLSSCYVGSIDDSLEGIMDSYKNMSIISKLGGGIGYDVSHIRSLGSSIDGYEGKAGGLIPFMKIANDVAVAFDQLGVRKGAIAVYLETWHKDIMEFLELRKNSGEERRRAHDLFTALWINDLFMERVRNDEDWTLFDPHDVRDLLECYGKDFENKYVKYENDPTINKTTLKAKNMWKEILRQYFETGMPFLCFKDTANVINPNPHRGIIRSSNLCVTGDTNILTKEYGNIPIGELVEEGITKVTCWNGSEWSETEIFKTSDSQKVLTVELDNEVIIEATPYHKWWIQTDEKNQKIIETKDLQPGMMLIKSDSLPMVDHGNDIMASPYSNGLFSAEGTFIKKPWFSERIYLLQLYNEKMELSKYLDNIIHESKIVKSSETCSRKRFYLKCETMYPKFFVPGRNFRLEDRLSWLAGLLDGDGTVTNNNGAQSIQLSSIELDFLRNIRLMLQEIGVYSKISVLRENGYRPLPINNGSNNYKKCYRLLISGSGCNQLLNLGLKLNRLKLSTHEYKFSYVRYTKVRSIKDFEKYKPTYCGNEPKKHMLMFNGMVLAQCSEIFQNTKPTNYSDCEIEINDNIKFKSKSSYNDGEIAVCNLASINIAKTNTEEDIKRVVPIVVRMLDNVIDLNLYPVIESAITNQNYRSIGCGILGEAEYIATKQIMYGSKEHYNEINKIMSMISFNVINTSADLAQEKGSYKWFNSSKWNLGKLPMDYAKEEVLKLTDELPKDEMDKWNTLRDKVKKGMRNGYLMSIAPTSSISILMGTTASIEACYKKKWYEENLTGQITVTVPNLNLDTFNYYISAYDVDQISCVELAAIRQKWIDQGQSLNIFVKLENSSGKYLNGIYMRAWELGLKSTYYLRSQSPEVDENIPNRQFECTSCQ